MHWNDLDEGTWEGITVRLTAADIARAPLWSIDLARPGGVRISAGDAVRWWGVQQYQLRGVGLLRGAPMSADDAVVRAITTEDLMAVDAAPGTVAWWRHWSRWFVREMVASGRSPLRPGLWWLTPVIARDVGSLTIADARQVRDGLASRWNPVRRNIEHAEGDLWTEDLLDENWGLNGSYTLLPMRRASRPDNGRVKSWRKRAREGVLPPVLVHYVAALTSFALLDGHDRYAAARAEGVPVPWLDVTAVSFEERYPPTASQQAGWARQMEIVSNVSPPLPTAKINQLYQLAYDDRPRPVRACYGRVLAGGRRRWEEEVTQRLAALGLSSDASWFLE